MEVKAKQLKEHSRMKLLRVLQENYYSAFNEYFFQSLDQANLGNSNFLEFVEISVETLDKRVPCKKKYVRGTHLCLIANELSRPSIRRVRLANKFLQNTSEKNRMKYVKQKTDCV